MNLQHIKNAQIITSIYNTFREGSAIIAGGYVRDVYLGREPKDIDILIEWESKLDYREAEILADRLGYTVELYQDTYGDNEAGGLRSVIGLKDPKTNKVIIDLIFLNCSVHQRIQNFPCTLSQIWLVKDTIEMTTAFLNAVDTMTLLFKAHTSEEYRDRMTAYFADYKVEYE